VSAQAGPISPVVTHPSSLFFDLVAETETTTRAGVPGTRPVTVMLPPRAVPRRPALASIHTWPGFRPAISPALEPRLDLAAGLAPPPAIPVSCPNGWVAGAAWHVRLGELPLPSRG